MESPRLLTSTSRAPMSLRIRAIARSTSSDFVTSATRGTTRRPVALAMSAARPVTCLSVRLLMTTSAPASARAWAMPLPMPPPAPLRSQPLLGRYQVRAVLRVQPVRVRPVLVHPAPRVRPVVVDLASQEMATDTPHVLVLAQPRHVLVAHEHVVDVLHLERQVVQPRAIVPDAEERVVIDVGRAPVEPVEGPDEIVLAALVDVVRADEPERLAEPPHRLLDVGRGHHPVADALDPRGAHRQPHDLSGPLQRVFPHVQRLALHRDRLERLDPVEDLDLVAVRLLQPDPFAAAGLV